MNTTASYSSDHSSWLNTSSRRNSIESVLSIQGKETDYVRDTSDTEWVTDQELEYEPATEPEDEGPVDGDTSEDTDNQIISTKVLEVSVNDDGDLEFADSEQTDTEDTDSEMDLHDYWKCAQCHNENNNPLYRYCERCFKVRKNFFPPRPKRKQKIPANKTVTVHRLIDRDSGVDSVYNSQELSQLVSCDSEGNMSTNRPDVSGGGLEVCLAGQEVCHVGRETCDRKREVNDSQVENEKLNTVSVVNKDEHINDVILETKPKLKRRAESEDRQRKRKKIDYSDSDSSSDHDNRRKSKSVGPEVASISKMNSDPSLTIESLNQNVNKETGDNMCIVCFNEPKSGVFVHGRIAHICCCYKCAVKVWAKSKRCPVCNCKVSNVLKAVVM